MLYLAIDQHPKPITVCVRNEDGDTLLRRQVSTRAEKIETFLEQLAEMDSQFMAILEVCGFNDWLIETLREKGCRDIVLIHPEKPGKRKTDRRDAQKLADRLWVNRERLAAGQTVRGLRRVYMVSQKEREDRQLTSLRKTLGQRRTRNLNKIHRIINRHNLIWNYPTKSFQMQAGRRWLEKVDEKIVERARQVEPGKTLSATQILMSAPVVSHYSGLTLASRIGPIERFPSPRSLANYFGLTPGCHNSGNSQDRLGSITKEGSTIARFPIQWNKQIDINREHKLKSSELRRDDCIIRCYAATPVGLAQSELVHGSRPWLANAL